MSDRNDERVMVETHVPGTLDRPSVTRVLDLNDQELVELLGDRVNNVETFTGWDD